MAAQYRDGEWIGDVAPGAVVLGRTYANRFASMTASKLLTGNAGVVLAQDRTARPIVPTSVKATNPTAGDAPASSIPKPVIIGAAVLGVLAIGLVAFKVAKKK